MEESKKTIVVIHGTSHHPDVFKFNGCTDTKRADETFKFLCNHVRKYGSLDEKNRPVWIDEDGMKTPTYTFSINNVYDVLIKNFPLMTLRYTAWRTGARDV